MEQLQGALSVEAMLDEIPAAAQNEFQDLMGRLARDVLAIEQGRTPRATGALAAGLSSQLLVDEKLVRLRVGLLGLPSGPVTTKSARRTKGSGSLGNVYYGRFVEFGRMAQTVLRKFKRLLGGTSPENLKRRIRDQVGAAKPMNVGAVAPGPFVNVPDGEVDQLVQSRLQDFLERVVSRAEGA